MPGDILFDDPRLFWSARPPSASRHDAGLKLLCVMFCSRDEKAVRNFSVALSRQDQRGKRMHPPLVLHPIACPYRQDDPERVALHRILKRKGMDIRATKESKLSSCREACPNLL